MNHVPEGIFNRKLSLSLRDVLPRTQAALSTLWLNATSSGLVTRVLPCRACPLAGPPGYGYTGWPPRVVEGRDLSTHT